MFKWPLTLKHIASNEVHPADTTFTVEELYQAFKERLTEETSDMPAPVPPVLTRVVTRGHTDGNTEVIFYFGVDCRAVLIKDGTTAEQVANILVKLARNIKKSSALCP